MTRWAAAGAAVALLAAASCRAPVSKDDTAVCTSTQRVVDALEADDSRATFTALDGMLAAIGEADDERLRREGARFRDAVATPVEYGSMTLGQHVERGKVVLRESAGALQGILDSCERLGREVDATGFAR